MLILCDLQNIKTAVIRPLLALRLVGNFANLLISTVIVTFMREEGGKAKRCGYKYGLKPGGSEK